MKSTDIWEAEKRCVELHATSVSKEFRTESQGHIRKIRALKTHKEEKKFYLEKVISCALDTAYGQKFLVFNVIQCSVTFTLYLIKACVKTWIILKLNIIYVTEFLFLHI